MTHSAESNPSLLVRVSLLLIALACIPLSVEAGERHVIKNQFDENREGWQIYDFHGGKPGCGNVFFPATWEHTGGVANSGYIWADDSRWRVDTPETPHSILPFIIYRQWVDGKALDIRGAKVSLYLRGDNLHLQGAKCLFWALNHSAGTRYHFTGKTLKVNAGEWGERQTIVFKNDENLWHKSWSRNPDKPASLDDVLRECDSYGLSFVGFTCEVTGRLAMDEFVIDGGRSVIK